MPACLLACLPACLPDCLPTCLRSEHFYITLLFRSHTLQVAAIVKRLDKDQDGNVSLEELRAEIEKAEIKEEILEEKLD